MNGESGTVYDAALDELQLLVDDAEHRDSLESSVINESRGHDVWALHTNLTAVEAAYANLANALAEARDEMAINTERLDGAVAETNERVEGWLGDVESRITEELEEFREETRELREADKEALEERLEEGFASTRELVEDEFTAAETRLTNQIEGLAEKVSDRFDSTNEALIENFETTNERTRTEADELYGELSKILDQRFSQVDQNFAALRADLEILKALQMELVKERVGRPDLIQG